MSDGEGHDPSKMLYSGKKRPKDCTIEILAKEIIGRQLDNISSDRKLQSKDIMRICKNIDRSIFDRHGCCLWGGHVTNMNNLNKGRYVNFYFRRKKVALHRLLYVNFIGKLNEDEYLKFNCDNKGICCNIRHLKKFRYQKIPEKKQTRSSTSSKKSTSKSTNVMVISSSTMDADWEKHKHKLTLRLD
jgi:hypothetical protein